MKYLFNYQRRKSIEVNVGGICMGANNPIRIQTMTNTKTTDTLKTIEQIERCIEKGTEYIRLTIPTPADCNNIIKIKDELAARGSKIPIVADIHFNAKLALMAAPVVDKVRINPGNFVDKKRFANLEYSNEEYSKELERIEDALLPLINLCKENNTAIRIGTNHGSLSDRIMSKYGDTPEGMAESSMEFLRILRKHDFNNVVISMKASNTRIMVYATRLLVKYMNDEGMAYPIHLGVTEAGEGEDGRIKSAVGIGALLVDGIGDTIRVSLTEEPENELPVAQKLVDYIKSFENHTLINHPGVIDSNPYRFKRRETIQIENIGGNQAPVVVSKSLPDENSYTIQPDLLYDKGDQNKLIGTETDNQYHVIGLEDLTNNMDSSGQVAFVKLNADSLNEESAYKLKQLSNTVLLLDSNNANYPASIRATVVQLMNYGVNLPVIARKVYNDSDMDNFQLKSAVDFGALFIDGLLDGIWIENKACSSEQSSQVAFGILQASRVRTTKTEYISCPSCGRTLFDLQETTKLVREKTSHLKNLKIGIMGCIVNGPGEMADADYGYVGAGPGKITLYKKQEVVKKNIPQDNAVAELINVIKENGDWINP
ncbi:MAG: (E)-4-hydroxy-3-methylbut-2-enyl-diphosphate synthase [Bacteroidales bacterium]|nr:(E)-4-hydroxy-3-methylbut-2-enyl-diphosphate synthase [Bacteroidales bacterium]